jgi:excisionase family DNA binding protein
MGKRRTRRSSKVRKRNGTLPLRLEPLKKACEYGHFSRSFAYHLIRRHKIAAHKLGRRTLIDLNSVDHYLRTLPRIE